MYIPFYNGITLVCTIVLTILSVNMLLVRNHLKPDIILVAFFMGIALNAIDLVWGLVFEGTIAIDAEYGVVLNILYSMIATAASCSWMEFALRECRIDRDRLNRIRLVFEIVPVAIIIVLNVASFWTGWLFTVESSGDYEAGPYYALYAFIVTVPIILADILFFRSMLSSPVKGERGNYMIQGVCTMAVIASMYLSVIDSDVPIMCIAITLSAVIIAITIQNKMITLDNRTGLENGFTLDRRLDAFFVNRRRAAGGLTATGSRHRGFFCDLGSVMDRMDRFIDRFITGFRGESRCISMAVFDIDAFKPIVSEYGHAKSGEIIAMVADVMKECCRRKPLYPMMMGNNAFAIIHYGETEALEIACREFCERITEIDRTLPYTLHLSYGISTSEEEGADSHDGLIALAEKRMRASKNQYYGLIGYKRAK